FAPAPPDPPEPPQRADQPQAGQSIPRIAEAPRQRAVQVGLLALQARPPRHLVRPLQLRLRALRQVEEEARVAPPDRIRFATFEEPVERILADRLQHAEMGLPGLALLGPE